MAAFEVGLVTVKNVVRSPPHPVHAIAGQEGKDRAATKREGRRRRVC